MENAGWAVKDGKRILIASLRETKEEVERWKSQYSSHVASLSGAYKIIKVKLVEIGG